MAFELPHPTDDGLVIPEVGPWSIDKHHFLRRYIDAFTKSMRNKRWSGLHYLDLFASAGIERIKGTGALEWGSALLAAQSPHGFSRLHLSELDKDRFEALQVRVLAFEHRTKPQLIRGDANAVAPEIIAALPPRSLTLAFLDPHGLHLNFETLRVLSRRRVDLLIFFPDHLDALRNWEAVYRNNPHSNLDKVLGTPIWRERLEATAQSNWASALSALYIEQIRTLGYTHFDSERISLPNGRFLYKLIFCTANAAGLKIWQGTSTKKPDNQGRLNFGPP